MSKTYLPTIKEVKRQWLEINAANVSLGRLATKVATILRGKHKAVLTPHMDLGDLVVVINADKVKFTGRKLLQKTYKRHSGYLGGLKKKLLRDAFAESPEKVVTRAIRNMLPVNKMRAKIIHRLKVITAPTHNFKIDKKI